MRRCQLSPSRPALNAALWSTMGAAIVVLWLATLVIAAFAARRQFGDRPFTLAFRFGLLVALIGMALGFLMTAPTADQLQAIESGATSLAGAHSVGVADGGPGLPVTAWSTTGGDLRVSHFVGLHALQALPLLAWLLALGTPTGAAIGWAHFIAFDLFGGGWEYLDARQLGVYPLVMAPVLLLTILLAPLGMLVYLAVRALPWRRTSTASGRDAVPVTA